ncbi:four helix bundle protein [Pseudothauera rhizosphaerae]|uniref:Four helix bundle protein n=1 Tax=Pseudothauera rhizosphaerae TaxID=2565932 RepID=A0A4S4AFX6_9RHOO|nr:four helix bundle protein [Pseudothauera rhizosphaerae]THF58038.1 four helix bundle protein [Pseudothauera rhizosphaerae]
MALHTDTEIYRATYSLCQLVTQLVANMPRNYKADFGAELRRRCMGLVMRTYEANTAEADERPAVLRRMRHEVEAVNLSLRLAKDLRLISAGQYARAIAITESIAKQATGWQKHTESRLSPARQGGRANAHR